MWGLRVLLAIDNQININRCYPVRSGSWLSRYSRKVNGRAHLCMTQSSIVSRYTIAWCFKLGATDGPEYAVDALFRPAEHAMMKLTLGWFESCSSWTSSNEQSDIWPEPIQIVLYWKVGKYWYRRGTFCIMFVLSVISVAEYWWLYVLWLKRMPFLWLTLWLNLSVMLFSLTYVLRLPSSKLAT